MSDTMRAAVIAAPREIRIESRPLPQPGAGQIRVRLEGCGVCHSNLPSFEGREWFKYPLAPGNPGHEGWGRIDAVGQGVSGLSVGDRVAFLSSSAYATHDVVDSAQAVKLPPELDDMPFPGEPLGCAVNIFRRSDIQAGQTVAIVGIGFLGAVVCKLAVDAGATVIAVARREFSQKLAKQFGAQIMVPMDDHWKIIERVRDLTRGQFCDRVVECVGEQWPLDLSAELTRERGKLVIAGYHQDGPRQVNMQLWNWRGLDVVNAHERDPKVYVEGIRLAAEAVAQGRLDPRPLLSHSYSLENLSQAFEDLTKRPGDFVKGWVKP